MHQNWLAINYLAKSVSVLRAHIRSICFVHIHAHSVPGQLFHPGYATDISCSGLVILPYSNYLPIHWPIHT